MLDEDEVSRVGRLGRYLRVACENVREGWENPHLQRDVRHRDGKGKDTGKWWEEGGLETWVEMSEGVGVLSPGPEGCLRAMCSDGEESWF